jgi:feruloyl-CoA synthase
MIFPDLDACTRLAGLPAGTDAATVIEHPAVRQRFAENLTALANRATGSSNHVARALLMAVPPDIDKGEVTDKGSINQRAVRNARPELVEALYAEPPGPGVFDLPRKDLR